MLVYLFLGLIIGVSLALVYIFNKKATKSKALNKYFYQNHWSKIMNYLDDEQKYGLAVIEADKLLDRAFKDKGFKGQTTGERLTSAGRFLSDKEKVWQAHKLRNNLVHEMNVKLNFNQTRQVLNIFKSALKDLGGL